MKVWSIGAVHAQSDENLPISAVEYLIGALTASDLSLAFLNFLNRLAPVDFLTHVQYMRRRTGSAIAPELLRGHSAPDIQNTTAQCFAIYRERFWKLDECTEVAQTLSDSCDHVAVLHFASGEGPAPWRREVYRRMQISDRLSIVYSTRKGTVFGVNLYRTSQRKPFLHGEICRLIAVAPLIRQVHCFALASSQQACVSIRRLEHAHHQLRTRFPELSEREVDVCSRIACGISAEGIAAEFGLSCSTVTTLRKRAYSKLRLRGIVPGRALLAELMQ